MFRFLPMTLTDVQAAPLISLPCPPNDSYSYGFAELELVMQASGGDKAVYWNYACIADFFCKVLFHKFWLGGLGDMDFKIGSQICVLFWEVFSFGPS